MDLLDGLNPEQREAVTTVEGPLLVNAGPGSGKTRIIVHRIAYMVLQARINPRYILAVTFSRKAAAEMRKRLDVLLCGRSTAVSVSTIHSACLRMLRREGIPGRGTVFEVLDEDEQRKLLGKCMERAGLDNGEYDLRRIKSAISYAKTNMRPGTFTAAADQSFDDSAAAVFHIYQKALETKHALDYDDMLVFAHRLLSENQAVLKKYQQAYRYILVDEFQDTSSLQYQIIRMLGARHRNVCVVGDPDQTIYSWRQANLGNIISFHRDFPGTRVIGMEKNYRSTVTIVDAANALISHNSLHKEKSLRTSHGTGRPISIVRLTDEDGEGRYIAGEIIRLCSELALTPGSFAVLYRVNAQSRALEEAFNAAGLPYNLVGGTPFYKRREILDMVAWLRLLRNPADDAALVRVIRIAGRGIGAQGLQALQDHSQKLKLHLHQALEHAASGSVTSLSQRARNAAARFHSLLEELRRESRRLSTVTLLSRIIERTDYRDSLKAESDPDERWENVLELISLAGAYEHLSPIQALDLLLQKINTAADAAEHKNEAEAVTFNTLHGSKGSEFPVVFIAGMEEGLLPHGKSMDDKARLEEERRLCYVGITRAMDIVYLTHVEKRRAFGEVNFRQPSRFLGELPPGLVKFVDHVSTERRQVQ